MHLLLFGTGCDSCREIARNIETAIASSSHEVIFEKSTDLHRMLSFGVQSTPSVVLEGKVISVGRKLSVDEIIVAFDTAARQDSTALRSC